MAVKIFISSKLRHLKAERDTAENIINGHKFIASRCEKWGAFARHTEDTCRRKVRESDIVIFILGQYHSPMVRAEYDEAKKQKKPCLALVKQTSHRDIDLQQLIDQDMKHRVVLKYYSTIKEFREYLHLSISDLIEERVKSEKERAVIQQAYKQCGSMNDKILKANLSQPPQGFQPDFLDGIRRELFAEKREIEKILGESI